MLSIKVIVERSFFSALGLVCFLHLSAQENSPFSRYGLGDIYPAQNIATRAMGGISAAYANDQALNTLNPASYSAMKYVQLYGGSKGGLISYDIGITIDGRTLRNTALGQTYKSTNFLPSYLQFGVPLSSKADFKKRGAALVFGLKPYTRIHYSISDSEVATGYTKGTLYEGNGGLNQVFMGLGKRYGNLSLGFNVGYAFGTKNIDTKITLANDSVHYYMSSSSYMTDFHGYFFSPGIQYNIKLSETKKKSDPYSEAYFLRFGASGTLNYSLTANTDTLHETFEYNAAGSTSPVDTVLSTTGIGGKIKVPGTYNAGFMFSKKYMVGGKPVANKWSAGADYSATKWTDYRYYGKPDLLVNSWTIRAGGEFVPSVTSTRFFTRSTYRLGFYTGKDYINADGNQYKVSALTIGFGFYIKKFTNYDNNSTFVNTALEIGKRGTGVNNINENFVKFSVGLSLSDLWFTRRKYE